MTKYILMMITKMRTFRRNISHISLNHAETSMYKGFDVREMLLEHLPQHLPILLIVLECQRGDGTDDGLVVQVVKCHSA